MWYDKPQIMLRQTQVTRYSLSPVRLPCFVLTLGELCGSSFWIPILTVSDIIFSFHWLSLCVFILHTDRHTMLLQCANMYARTNLSFIQNTIWNIILFGLGSLKDTLCKFANVNNELNTQLPILITGLLTPEFACNV